jgi:hypothetical protein
LHIKAHHHDHDVFVTFRSCWLKAETQGRQSSILSLF